MRTLKASILLYFLGCALGSASSDKIFFGRWQPPASLEAFWNPIQESWWNPGDLSRISAYGKGFARKTDPHDLIDDIINDLKRHPSVERTFVYSMLVVHWEPKITLKLLKPYARKPDADVQRIANDLIADVEEYQGLATNEKQ